MPCNLTKRTHNGLPPSIQLETTDLKVCGFLDLCISSSRKNHVDFLYVISIWSEQVVLKF